VDDPPVEDPLMDDPEDVLPVPEDPLLVASPPLPAPAAKATLLDAASAAANINVLIFMSLSMIYWSEDEARRRGGFPVSLRQQSSLRDVSDSLLWAGTAICARRCGPIGP
jgi:hypothetical protein